jgi:ATP-binding cassette subfamily B protein
MKKEPKKVSEPQESKPSKKEKPPKPKFNMWQNAWWMLKLSWAEKEKKVPILCILSAALAISSNLTGLFITPVILGTVESHAPLHTMLLTILGFVGLNLLINTLSSYINANEIYGKITLRSAIISRLNTKACITSYPNLNQKDFQELMKKANDATSSNNRSSEAIWYTMQRVLQNMTGFIIYLFLMSALPPALIAVVLLTSLLNYIISMPLNNYSYRHKEELSKILNRLGYIQDVSRDHTMAKDIRLFGLRPWLQELQEKAIKAHLAYLMREQNVLIWSGIADLILAFLRNGIAYAYLIGLVLNDGISISMFLLYFSATGNFNGWVSGILNSLLTMHRQSVDISIIREVLDYSEPFHIMDGEPLRVAPDCHYELRLEHVSFRYPEAEKDTLTDIDLTLHPGEKLAIVGLNGAGKTTLVKLLCGLLDPTKGRVLLDGRDIREYNRRDYYKLFSAVFQNFSLLPSTIAANVAQTEENIDMKRVSECVEKASLTEKIESLPDGYENKLNREIHLDAVMLSGGETQRLMLARALYKNGPVVVLDEPTAALDPIAESDLYQKYSEMTRGRSSVYISHRLASTRFCDRIILISDGRIIEEGTHETLLQKGAAYAELFEVQSRYYREEAPANV